MATADLNQLRANAQHLHEKAVRHRQAMEWAARETDTARGTASSADGSVRVTVDQTGMLTELDIDPDASRQQPNTELARLIVETVRQATVNVRNHVQDTYQALVDEGAIPALPQSLLPAPDVKPAIPAQHTNRTAEPDDGEPQSWLNDLD